MQVSIGWYELEATTAWRQENTIHQKGDFFKKKKKEEGKEEGEKLLLYVMND